MTKRIFSAQELNHLQKYSDHHIDINSVGEEPVEYLTGHAIFMDHDFKVDRSTLIPRIESEKIIEMASQFIAKNKLSHPDIADIGTGTGCLGISLAFLLQKEQLPYTLYLSDVSTDALKIARFNVTNLLPSPANIFFEESDLLSNYPKIKFDLILANLPYIPSQNIATLSSSVKDFEPLAALDGGPDGTNLINKLLKQLPEYLNSGGQAILEIDDTHSINSFVVPHVLDAKIENDIFGIPRFLVVSQKT